MHLHCLLYRPDEGKQSRIMKCCWSFFLEVLSTFCANNPVILTALVRCVFADPDQSPKDEKLYSYIQNHSDQLLFLQSFIIKLVMTNRYSYDMYHYPMTTLCSVPDISDIVEDIIKRVTKCNQASNRSRNNQMITIDSVLALIINYIEVSFIPYKYCALKITFRLPNVSYLAPL